MEKINAKKRTALFLIYIIAFTAIALFSGAAVYARDGIGGLEGIGVSSGEAGGRAAIEYSEYIFITGEPILVKGTVVVSKSESGGRATSAYSYKLNNFVRNVQLTRDISFETTYAPKDGGQTVTETALAREPSEKIVFNGLTYTLRRMDFTRTSLIDAKPAVSYYTGNTWYRKVYEAGGSTVSSASGNFLTLEATGGFYGFDQAWGSADFENTELVLEYAQNPASAAASAENGGAAEMWSGVANVRRSQSTVTELRYVENEPNAISFRGGFLETRRYDNVLEYNALLPEFDSFGGATDRLKRYADSMQYAAFPTVKRLVSPDLRQIRGHWSEEAVLKLYGLEILKTRPSEFLPDQYITRAEFAASLVAAAKPVPDDPRLGKAKAQKPKPAGKKAPAPSFTDVPPDHEYYAQIEESFARRLMYPIDKKEFRPNSKLTVADAAVTFIRALGLESAASAHGAITGYSDDDAIPSYARDALYVAQKIGLLRGDQAGYVNPKKELTKAEAAVMLDRLVEYMRSELKSDYRDHLMDY